MIQDGARRHYIVPLALQQAGILEMVYADWYVRKRSLTKWVGNVIKWFDPKTGQRMLDRRRANLDDSQIRANPKLAIRLACQRKRFHSAEEYYTWVSEKHYQWISSRGLGRANAVYGFVRNVDPRLFEDCRRDGLIVVSDQIIAPARIENAEYQEQQRRWPGWEKPLSGKNQHNIEMLEERTWAASDVVICGSEYVKTGLLACGVDSRKVAVVPYAPSGADLPLIERRLSSQPVIVGFTGSVSLRKGAPYFFEVAKRFDPKRVKFVMVGSSSIAPEVLEKYKGNVECIGSVPRSDIAKWLATFHIFFFPSTCEGCAGSVLEAMDTGLPIVSTVNSGTIVRHGVEGFIHDYGDVDAATASIERLVSDSALRDSMGLASRARIESFDMKWYCETLRTLFENELAEKMSHPRTVEPLS